MIRKKILFKLILMFFVFLIIAGIEVGLRLLNYGSSYRIFLEKEFNDKTYLRINPDAGKKTFQRDISPGISTDMFLKNKQEKTYRVFVLGASSSAGYPWEYNFSFPNILKEHLIHYKANYDIEMVNLSMPAVNSYAVVDIFRQLKKYDPDLVIVYTGHNEFYGGLGAGTGGRSVFFKRLYLFFRDFRLFQLYERSIERLRSKGPGDLDNTRTLMHRLSEERIILPESSERKAVKRQYQKNIRKLFRISRRREMDVLMIHPVSNIWSHPPFHSYSKNDDGNVEAMYRDVKKLYKQSRLDQALSKVDDMLVDNPEHAGCHYIKGLILCETGHREKGLFHLKKARDYDALPFRMTDALEKVLKEECTQYEIRLFDPEAELNLQKRGDYSRTFCDHLHFTPEGAMALGEALAEDILKRPVDLIHTFEHFTRLDTLLGEIRLEVLLGSWPFTEDIALFGPTFTPQTDYDRIAVAVWEGRMTWEEGHVRAARLLEKEGKTKDAIREYMALYHLMPYNEAPLVEAARLYSHIPDWKQVRILSEKALDIYFDPRALLYHIQSRAAARHFGKITELTEHYAEQLKTADPTIRGMICYFEGWVYANRKEYSKALEKLDRALDFIPGYQQAVKLRHEIQAVFQ
jgi:tetratricopeptide (TPR) repeat protein